MQRVNKKECPKCKSENIIDVGDRVNGVIDYKRQEINDVENPICRCKDCDEYFVFKINV